MLSHADPDRVRPDIRSCRVVVELFQNSIILAMVPGRFLLAHTLLLNSMCEPCQEISMHTLLNGTESMLVTSTLHQIKIVISLDHAQDRARTHQSRSGLCTLRRH